MCTNPQAITGAFIKAMEHQYGLQGSHGNPETRTTKKMQQQQSKKYPSNGRRKTPANGTFQENPCAKVTNCKSAETDISAFAENPESKPTTKRAQSGH